MYDHSGITISPSPFSCPWDSGQVGIIYVTPDKIRKEYSVKRISKKLRDRIEGYLRSEVKTYDDYLTGNVWGYDFESDNDCDSCWGFYGDIKTSGMLEYIPKEASDLIKAAWERRE